MLFSPSGWPGWQPPADLGSHTLKMAEPPSAWILVQLHGIEPPTWTFRTLRFLRCGAIACLCLFCYTASSTWTNADCNKDLKDINTPGDSCVCTPRKNAFFHYGLWKVLCSVSDHTLKERLPAVLLSPRAWDLHLLSLSPRAARSSANSCCKCT